MYQGWYCTPCETFIKDAPKDAKNIKCNSCERDTQFLKEEAYFFRLSQFQDKLLNFYEQNPGFIIPSERFQEVINFVESGLKDLCVSRASVSWAATSHPRRCLKPQTHHRMASPFRHNYRN